MKKLIFTILFLTSNLAFSQTEGEKIMIELTQEIIKNAEKKWPNDYTMQEYEVRKQINSLLEIQKLKLEMYKIEQGEKK